MRLLSIGELCWYFWCCYHFCNIFWVTSTYDWLEILRKYKTGEVACDLEYETVILRATHAELLHVSTQRKGYVTKANIKHTDGHRNHILWSKQRFLWCHSEGEGEKTQRFHMVTGGVHKCSCQAQLSDHWLPLFLCSPSFTDNVMQWRSECLPQWPNMALPYPPHSHLNQSRDSININKIPQSTEKLLQGCNM